MNQMRAIEPWVLGPLERFVSEAGARLTLIMTPAGQGRKTTALSRASFKSHCVRSILRSGGRMPVWRR